MNRKALIWLVGLAMVTAVLPFASSGTNPGPGHIWLNCEDLDGNPCPKAQGGGWKAGGWVYYGPYEPDVQFSFYLTVENRANYPMPDLRIVKAIHDWTSSDDFEWIMIEDETEYLSDFDTTQYNPFAWQFGGNHNVFTKKSDAIWGIYHYAPNILPAKTTIKLMVTVQLGPDPSDFFEIHFDAFDAVTGDHSPDGHDVTLISGIFKPTPGNEPPTCVISYTPDGLIYEGDTVYFTGTASDPDGGEIIAYYWDFDTDFDWDGNSITDDDIMAMGPEATFTWYDNGLFNVMLTVIDEDGQTGKCFVDGGIEILNKPPEITSSTGFMQVDLCLRVAGSKWSNVMMTLYIDYGGNGEEVVAALEVERWPGPPDQNPTHPEDSACIPLTLEVSGNVVYTAYIEYDPYPDQGDAIEGDQPNNGNDPFDNAGNPVWLILQYPDGNKSKCHHTFNTQQSMIRNSDHWNHVEPWIVDIVGGAIPGEPITFVAEAMDAGTDDLTFLWDFGDGSSVMETTYYYDNTLPNDPLPSPYEPYFGGTMPPIYVTDTQTHTYASPGTYTVTLTVLDDDGGANTTTMTVVVNGGLYCP
jgi:hypothetical protein